MMITSVEVEKFEPFGKAFCSQHPFANAQSQANSPSNQENKNESTYKWKLRSLRENPDCHEELFIQNNTVVWSVGKSQKVRTVKKCYTAKSPVLDCLWCTFHLPSGNSSGNQDTVITGEPLHSLCIVQNDCIDVLSKDGALFTITLPFPVKQVVSLKEGLLLERTTEPGEVMGQKRDVPTMFSVLHPLDEPRPVISKVQGKISKICDPTVSVVFACSDPPLVMTYDFVIGLHSVWHASKAKAEDCPESPTHVEHPAELHFSNILHHPTPVLSAGAHSRLSVATPISFSPFRSFTPASAIKAHVQSPAPIRLLSPALNQISLNRTMSPAIDSPLGIGLRSPLAFCSPSTSCCSSKEESSWDSFQPLLPEVCLTQVWQETQIAVRYGTKGKASKAFLIQDKFGATFLCYLLGQLDKLRGVQFAQEGDCLEFMNAFEIPARDAVPMEKLNLMLVLEPNCTLVIYSGMVKGGQVHLPMFPIIKVQESSQFNTPDKILSFASIHLNKSDVDMQDLEVRQSKTKPLQDVKVASLRDAVSTTCNLVLTDGSICRITLPMLSQNLAVTACLEALKCLLPASLVIKAHLACYASAQVPHSQDSRGEWKWFTDCILDLMGYPPREMCDSPDLPAAKKSKTQAEDNENKAWEMLMNSAFHQDATRQENGLQQLINKEMPIERSHSFKAQFKKDALLYQYIPSILFAWHLIYEDLKLNILAKDSLYPLAQFLCRLAVDLGRHPYVEYYYRDFPSLFSGSWDIPACITKDQQTKMFFPMSDEPPSIIQWLYQYLNGQQVAAFPLLPGMTKTTFNIIMLYSLFIPMGDESHRADDADKLFTCIAGSEETNNAFKESLVTLQAKLTRFHSVANKVVAFLADRGLTCKDLDCLPFGVAVPIREALHQSAADPPLTLPTGAYELIGREDLASMFLMDARKLDAYGPLKKATLKEGELDDGFNLDDEILSLRFGKDLRVQEIRRLLQSSKPVSVNVQKPEVSDHDFIQEQETRLLVMCKRTMALPVGRGMFTMATSRPVLTETLPIPPLDLTGRAPPRNTTVGLEHVETPADMKLWPQFHNGVATGLRIAQGISQIDSTWIVYNKPKNNQLTEEHAGFLMALGLNGHLKNLSYMNLHDYLCKGHELTTVGLLLGTAAAKRGTMDVTTTKMLSIHIDALLPPTSAELDLPHSSQVAAILGVGLVYQGTAQRRMAEVLLSEIGRPPGPEMENAVNRESYSLAAGLALGLVMLEHGSEAASVADLKIADQLYHYMVGGQTKPQTGTQKEKFKSPSYQIKEGDSVNISVTGPGATLALGLMFLKTNNTSVAAWFDAPDTQFLLDFIRPDFLLLRLLSRGLIMWDSIYPSIDWVESHIPAIIRQCDSGAGGIEGVDADMESLSQAKVNIIAGCCMAMGLRFAGSANQEAFNCLMHYTKHCKDLLNSSAVEQAGKPTVETCLDTILLSLAMVMAGTGNLDVLRIARQLRKRHSPDVPYGSHMAVHMAIGLLFLGGGRFTLSTSGPSIAALICAFYPRFPISSTDNRYHLQAFRHLYVLATEPRVLVPREVDTNKACHVPLEVTLKETNFYPETTLNLTAPCILPELQLIKKIRVSGLRYWPVTIDFTENKDSACLLTANLGTLFVKRRTGFLTYADDPKGHRNILAKTFAAQTDQTEVVRSFSSDPNLIALAELFGDKDNSNDRERKLSSFIASALVETVTEEKPEVLRTLLRMWQIVHNLDCQPDPSSVWQMKLVLTFYRNAFPRISRGMLRKPLVNADFIEEYKFLLEESVDRLMQKDSISPRSCYSAEEHKRSFCPAICCFAVYHDVPLPHALPSSIQQGGIPGLPVMLQDLADLPLAMTALLRLQAQS